MSAQPAKRPGTVVHCNLTPERHRRALAIIEHRQGVIERAGGGDIVISQPVLIGSLIDEEYRRIFPGDITAPKSAPRPITPDEHHPETERSARPASPPAAALERPEFPDDAAMRASYGEALDRGISCKVIADASGVENWRLSGWFTGGRRWPKDKAAEAWKLHDALAILLA